MEILLNPISIRQKEAPHVGYPAFGIKTQKMIQIQPCAETRPGARENNDAKRLIARCNFQWAHGFAFISDIGARNLAMGYLALVINNGTINRGPASESLGN